MISLLKFVVVTETNPSVAARSVWLQLASRSVILLSRVLNLKDVTSGVKGAGLSSALLEEIFSCRPV